MTGSTLRLRVCRDVRGRAKQRVVRQQCERSFLSANPKICNFALELAVDSIRIPPSCFGIFDPLSRTSTTMSAFAYKMVGPVSKGEAVHLRGHHVVTFVGADARGPELKQALPELGWGTGADGNLELAAK